MRSHNRENIDGILAFEGIRITHYLDRHRFTCIRVRKMNLISSLFLDWKCEKSRGEHKPRDKDDFVLATRFSSHIQSYCIYTSEDK